MISEERSSHVNKQAAVVGMLIRSPKKRLAQLGRKASNGSTQSNSSAGTVRSAESSGVRQPAKSKIRRHNNNNNNKRLSGVFAHSPNLRRSGGDGGSASARDDPAELSCQLSLPGILKIFGSDICQGANYKSVLATTQSSAKELLKEALDRYSLEKEDAAAYVLCDVIGQPGSGGQWRRECFRVVGEHEKPLVLQSLWKPKEGFSRRFEIQLRARVEEQSLKERDTVTAGINAQARKLQRNRSRATSLFMDSCPAQDADGPDFWRSLSEMDLSAMGKEARGARRVQSQNRDDEDKDALRLLGTEKEETESSDDNATQYSIHPPFDFPYLLLLHGYSHRQDFVIYLLSASSTVLGRCGEHRAGEDEERLKVDILLFAPDVLPRHCRVRRLDAATLLQPLHGALVTRNGAPLREEAQLRPGDLVGLGEHYLFMFKDPTGTAPAAGPPDKKTPPWMSRLCPNWAGELKPACQSCGRPPAVASADDVAEDDVPALSYDAEQEDRVLREIMDMSEHMDDGAKLTAAFLFSLCIRRSATRRDLDHFRRLLLNIAALVQNAVWDKTKELAAVQSDSKLPPPTAELMSGLRPLAAWMANAIELLRFIQHRVPQLVAADWDRLRTDPRAEDELASTRAACEEAMTVLEEVIMFTFQQSVYYLTKNIYSALPAALDRNPFSESGHLRLPDGLSGVLEVLREALELFTSFRVHADIRLQLCAYLFFFINASLFNTLMERGSVEGFYQWSRGVQIRANLDLLMDWLQSVDLAHVAARFFRKLSAAVNLLATPKETLLQASWTSLRSEFSSLNAAQLQHMLMQYGTGKNRPAGWTPGPERGRDASETADILESFDQHPPLILPTKSFFLEEAHVDPALLEQLARLQRAIGRTSPREDLEEEETSALSSASLARPADDPSESEEVATLKAKRNAHLDPSCLLTPPNTPQANQGQHDDEGVHVIVKEDDDGRDDVFTVEIHRGPHGLGLALVDGTKTPLRMSGIYVKSLVPESPAALCRRLKTGDRILAVNGVSLVGLDYSVGREMIRSSGDSLRLLVANMDANKNANKSSQTTKC